MQSRFPPKTHSLGFSMKDNPLHPFNEEQTTISTSPNGEEAVAEIKFKVLHAKDLRDIKFIGKMSPYIAFEHRKYRYKTEADVDGHCEPVWNQEVDVPIYSVDEDIKIECLDLGIIYDELICSTVMKISDILPNHNSEVDVPLHFKSKVAGDLKLYCFINRSKSKLLSNKNLPKYIEVQKKDKE